MKPDTMFFLLYATALVVFGVQRAAQSSPAVCLTASPPWPDVFPGETITLTCQVIESEGWTLVWVRHRQGGQTQLPASSSNGSVSVFALSAVKERHSGMYQCEAVKGNEQSFSNIHTITVSADRPQAVIVTDPPASVMFTGESVSLTCDIRKGSGWRYSWSRNTQGRLESLYARSTESQQKHILHSVRKSDSGEYLCQGARGQSSVIQSFPGTLVLNVSGEKPKPVITQNPPSGEIYTGERVTLSCGFGGDPAGWEYLWYKDTQRHSLPNTDSSSTDGSSFTISSAALAHSGEYRCIAARGRKPFYSEYSDPLTLEISVLPQTYLTVQSGWTEVFPTETVTLRCVIQGSSTEWMYKWYRDGRELPVDKAESSSVNGDTYTILSADQSHAGLYTCRGELTRRASVLSLISSSATLSVRGEKPKPVITQNPPSGEIYTGERVTLSCGFGGDPAGWEYLWYKDTQRHTLPNTDSSSTDGSSFTISSAALAHSGEYRCIAARGREPFYSDYSDPLTLKISVLPQTYLTVQSGWTEVFPTETVTLRCVIQGSSTEWMYKWYRDGWELPVDKAESSSVNGDTYTILSADQSHAGLYTCRGELTRRASVHSLISSSATMSVRALPQAVVTLDEGWMGVFITKGTLAMRCAHQGFTSANWTYTWYRDGTQISLNHTEERHTVGFWDSSSEGEYRCSGNRTDRAYYSLISEGFMPSHIRLYFIVALGGSVIIFITVVVLGVQGSKKCRTMRTSGQIKNQPDGGEFYSRVNADYISADHVLPTDAVYEEIDPSTETEGSEIVGQLSFYSAVQLKPLNQGPTA